jgi:tetratricopeptide (TPR) repeat protein
VDVMKNPKKISLIIIYFTLVINIFSANIYEEYQNAKEYYNQKDYKKAMYSLELVLNEVPDYEEAKLLYFKINYELNNSEKVSKLFKELITTDDDVRVKLFNYLMLHNETTALLQIYDTLENKEALQNIFLEYLYLNKEYNIILNKYPLIEYVKRIEKDKQKADNYYYEAISLLKNNSTNEAMVLMKKAIETYPENYIYYFKIGKVYADNKNFVLAEYNFNKALEYNDSEEIKLSLLKLYYDQKKYDKVYEMSRTISHLPEVRKILKSMYYEQKDDYTRVRIITRWNTQVTVDRRIIPNATLGDTYILSSVLPSVFDNRTGEKLATRTLPVARVRISRLDQKLATFEIIEEYAVVEVDQEYIIN